MCVFLSVYRNPTKPESAQGPNSALFVHQRQESNDGS